MKRNIGLIPIILAAGMLLASCTQDFLDEQGRNPQAEGPRTIAVSFGPQTRTALDRDGVTPKFTGKDEWIKVSNGKESKDCQVTVDDKGNASFTTDLTGTLTAVYPESAAKMNGDAIAGVNVSYVQDGTFANANICMAENITGNVAIFQNQTAVLCITPAAGDDTQYIEVSAEEYDISNYAPHGSTFTSHKVHVIVPETEKPIAYFVSILAPDGLTVGDLTFSDGVNEMTITGEKAATPIQAGTLCNVPAECWESSEEEVEITRGENGGHYYVGINGVRWATQNLAITGSGNKKWKGGKDSAVKVPGTDEYVNVGDYFQWAANENYALPVNVFGNGETDKGLLIYTSFTNTHCVDGGSEDKFEFKSPETDKTYRFGTAPSPYSSDETAAYISPYYDNGYTNYNEVGTSSELTKEDDVANIILGGTWRMPTKDEFQALYDATFWAWSVEDEGYYVFIPDDSHAAGTNENPIPVGLNKEDALLFFPATGGGSGGSMSNVGTGTYWSSNLYPYTDVNYAHCLSINPLNNINPQNRVSPQSSSSRCLGRPIRPVYDPASGSTVDDLKVLTDDSDKWQK